MKITRSKIFTSLCFATLIFPVLSPAEFKDRSVVLSGREGQMVLQQCSRHSPEGVTGFWAPSAKDVEKLEADIRTFMRNKRAPNRDFLLNDYYRQYSGFLRGDKKYIYVNGFYSPGKTHDWRNKAYVVCDGGGSFFGVEYEAETGQFSNLEFNGEA